MLTPEMVKLIERWQVLPRRVGSSLPPRQSFDAERALADHHRMSFVKITDADEIQAELVRLEVAQDWKRPIAGLNLYDLAPPAMRGNITKFYHSILHQPCGAFVEQHIEGRSENSPFGGQDNRVLKSLFLPFSDREGGDTIILGFSMPSVPGYQFGLRNQMVISYEQVQNCRFIDLGRGVPDVQFDMPLPQTRSATSRKSWWERFLPQGTPSTAGPVSDKVAGSRSSRPSHHSGPINKGRT